MRQKNVYNSAPFFSVITVVKNAENTIEACINSVRHQTCDSVEHIIVDGLSTDDTLKFVNADRDCLGSKISKVTSERDGGIYSAMNKGLRMASGLWVYFLNADDWLADNQTLSHVRRRLMSNDCDLFYGRLLCMNMNNGVASIHAPRSVNVFRLMSGGMYQQAWMFRKELVNKCGAFDESLRACGDIDYLMRLLQGGARVNIEPIMVAVFRVGGASSDFALVKAEHKLVEKRYCNPVLRILFKLWRSTLRSLMNFIRKLGPSVFD